jgi:heme-degrading monooxygenase HmoA
LVEGGQEVTVHVRQVTFRGARSIDAGVAYIRDDVRPMMSAQHGFRGISVSADREGEVLGALTMWASEEDLEASDSALDKARDGAVKIIGGVMTVENYEQTTEAMARLPVAGNAVVVTRMTVVPSTIDDQVAFFERDLLPTIEAQPGFCAMHTMVNRRYGRCVVSIVWEDRRTLDAYLTSMPGVRTLAQDRGVRFDELSSQDIVLYETG